ncbi:MAG: hypothetical protein FJ224_12610, partial [Lentisphaerae bacterium]|nr:hypothetical protein [Lentisphaerota bacterium]
MRHSRRQRVRFACALLACELTLPVLPALAVGHYDPEVRFTNLTVVERDAKTARLRFDITWDGSWRHEINHDAAWIFFKVRANTPNAEWRHVGLVADRVLNPTGYGQAAPSFPEPEKDGFLRWYLQGRADFGRVGGMERSLDFFASEPRVDTPLEFLVPCGAGGSVGMFLRRAKNGAGRVEAHGVTAILDLASIPEIPDIQAAQIRGFGIEMVYVAEGPFCLGTGGTEMGVFYACTEDGLSNPPYRVKSAGAIPTGRQPGKLWAQSFQPEDGGEIPAAFPNGYRAIYCMKQHLTPRRYVEFLQTLTPAQADVRWSPEIKSIQRSGTPPNYAYTWKNGGARDGAGLRCLMWSDMAAYMAWAGLRPMTELELEKIVRGPRQPIPNEPGPSYWGVDAFPAWLWESIKGADTTSECVVTIGNATGRKFAGSHGLGSVILPADWPQDDGVGSGLRCTAFPAINNARVSD